MADRLFTLSEANAAIVELRPIAERMVELRRRQLRAVAKRNELRGLIASDGGRLGPSDVADAEADVERLAQALAACVERLHDAGAQVKDLDTGLLDFPALRAGVEVLLCWRVGEDEIGYWHGTEEGFAGRKPVDFVE